MSTFLVCKVGDTTKSYTCKTTASKPYLRVKDAYLPLTTETGTGLKVKANGNTYRPLETYTTTTEKTLWRGDVYGTGTTNAGSHTLEYSRGYATTWLSNGSNYLTESSFLGTFYTVNPDSCFAGGFTAENTTCTFYYYYSSSTTSSGASSIISTKFERVSGYVSSRSLTKTAGSINSIFYINFRRTTRRSGTSATVAVSGSSYSGGYNTVPHLLSKELLYDNNYKVGYIMTLFTGENMRINATQITSISRSTMLSARVHFTHSTSSTSNESYSSSTTGSISYTTKSPYTSKVTFETNITETYTEAETITVGG